MAAGLALARRAAHIRAMQRMAHGGIRPLTEGERAGLSQGLADALEAAGVSPLIVARPALWARFAALWRGATPIMVVGHRIYWPGAPADLAGSRSMALLQHELQHVLEYATGALGPLRYVLDPRNWFYRYRLGEGSAWRHFAAEQRAQIAEDFWRLDRAGEACEHHRRVIPWAPTSRDETEP